MAIRCESRSAKYDIMPEMLQPEAAKIQQAIIDETDACSLSAHCNDCGVFRTNGGTINKKDCPAEKRQDFIKKFYVEEIEKSAGQMVVSGLIYYEGGIREGIKHFDQICEIVKQEFADYDIEGTILSRLAIETAVDVGINNLGRRTGSLAPYMEISRGVEL